MGRPHCLPYTRAELPTVFDQLRSPAHFDQCPSWKGILKLKKKSIISSSIYFQLPGQFVHFFTCPPPHLSSFGLFVCSVFVSVFVFVFFCLCLFFVFFLSLSSSLSWLFALTVSPVRLLTRACLACLSVLYLSLSFFLYLYFLSFSWLFWSPVRLLTRACPAWDLLTVDVPAHLKMKKLLLMKY